MANYTTLTSDKSKWAAFFYVRVPGLRPQLESKGITHAARSERTAVRLRALCNWF